MKKILIKILICLLSACLLVAGLAGCDKAEWKGTSMKNWGEGEVVGGFIGQTENYLYYINGTGGSSGDNTFGKPVKGALMAADKTDLSKTQVVVPKLFVATDYNAGIYIYDGYVYYGSPNTAKNSSGHVAKSEMTFARTKLDGTNTKEFFTISSLSAEYRIVEEEGTVYIVYYDAEDSAVYSYNTKTGNTKTVAESDIKTSKMQMLDVVKFAPNGSEFTLYYTVTVFSEKYVNGNSGRGEESYNKVYAYSPKQGSVEILDGESQVFAEKTIYEIMLAYEDCLFYKATANSETEYYFADFTGQAPNKIKLTSGDAIVSTALFEIEEEGDAIKSICAYTVAETKIKKTVLYSEVDKQDEYVALADTISTLLKIDDGYVYYINSTNQLARKQLNETANEERISAGTIATVWYKPQFLTVEVEGGVSEEYIFYNDTSALGLSYINGVKLADLKAENLKTEEAEEEEGEDTYYYEVDFFLGKMTNTDLKNQFNAKVSAFGAKLENGILPYEEDNGVYVVKGVEELREAYTNLSPKVKEMVSDKTIERYEEAIRIANLLKDVEGAFEAIEMEEDMSDYISAFNAIKAEIKKFEKSKDYNSVKGYLKTNSLNDFEAIEEYIEEQAEN